MTGFMNAIPAILNDCHRRSSSTPTKQPQRHNTTRSLVTEAIQAWLTLEPLLETDAPTRISDLQRTVRHLVRKCNIPIPSPGEEATATEWRQWAAGSNEIPGALETLTSHLSTHGDVLCNGKVLQSMHCTNKAPVSAAIQERLLGKRPTGGRVDGLLIGVDPTTGANVPCTAHDTIVSYLQQELENLGHEKGAGANAYASTSAFHKVLFDTKRDLWGNTLVRPKRACAMAAARVALISELKAAMRQLAPLDWKDTVSACHGAPLKVPFLH